MNTKIPVFYRECLKQAIKIRGKDQNIYNAILSALQAKKPKINEKQSIDILTNLTKLLTKVNEGDQKSIVKIIRIFTNSSELVTANLDFSPDYGTNAMNILQQDIEFKQLAEQDQMYVRKVVKKICDKKPTYKYKSVGKYLESISSENVETEMALIKNNPTANHQHLKMLSSASAWGWAYKTLMIKKQDKIDQLIDEMVNRKIFIL